MIRWRRFLGDFASNVTQLVVSSNLSLSGSPKLCPPMISTGHGVVIHRRNAISTAHNTHDRTSGRLVSSAFPRSRHTLTRKLGSSSATRCSETSASTRKTESVRQTFLGCRLSILVRMEKGSHRCHSRDGGPMASRRLPGVLETDLQSAKADWTKTDFEASSGINLSHGDREFNLGSASHPRGTPYVGL